MVHRIIIIIVVFIVAGSNQHMDAASYQPMSIHVLAVSHDRRNQCCIIIIIIIIIIICTVLYCGQEQYSTVQYSTRHGEDAERERQRIGKCRRYSGPEPFDTVTNCMYSYSTVL